MDKLVDKGIEKIEEVVDSIWNFGEKKQILKGKWKRLASVRDEVVELLRYEESLPYKKPKNEVQNWLADIDSIECRVQTSLEQSRWSAIFRDNVRKSIEEVTKLIEMGKFEGGLAMDVEHGGEETFPTTELVGEAFKTNKNKIWECLVNDEISSIGIYGMGGAGKTTLMKHIHNQLQEENDLKVHWITVSQDFRVDRLQTLIAKSIKLDLSECDISKRAARLLKALKGKQKCVLILDDLWDHFELMDVGIPVKENGCKLVLTTRSLDVCQKMSCGKIIEVVPLDENEAWRLFKEKLGAPLPSDVTEIAKLITKECDGLPLGIATMAGSMRGVDDIREWRNALTGLKESRLNDEHMNDKVFSVLKFSYRRLNDSTLQQCFLDCALYPEDYKIEKEQLIEHMIDENIIQGESRQAAFDEGHTTLNRLVKVCLLERVNDIGECLLERVNDIGERKCVKMHDLIRDMAIQILEKKGVMVKVGAQLAAIPDCEKWTDDLLKVSLSFNNIKEIPFGFSPICPKLSTLLLRTNDLTKISNSFFEQLKGIRVLDLSHTYIEELPNSICDLVNMNVLLLSFCRKLRDVPSLAKLMALKKLDLEFCDNIEKLPPGIEYMSKLRHLDLCDAGIKELPVGILPRLLHLQVLKLPCYLKGEELVFLRKLETLICSFHNVGELNTFTSSLPSNLNCYTLVVGEIDSWPEVICRIKPRDRNIYFNECSETESFLSLPSSLYLFQSLEGMVFSYLEEENAAPALPLSIPHSTFSQLKELYISCCRPSKKKLFPLGLVSKFRNLEALVVGFCNEMEEIIAIEEEDESHDRNCRIQVNLQKLKRFELENLPNLKSIFKGDIKCNSIEEIMIRKCEMLKRMPLSLLVTNNDMQLSRLPSLKRIHVFPQEWWKSVELVHPNAKYIVAPICRFKEGIKQFNEKMDYIHTYYSRQQ